MVSVQSKVIRRMTGDPNHTGVNWTTCFRLNRVYIFIQSIYLNGIAFSLFIPFISDNRH